MSKQEIASAALAAYNRYMNEDWREVGDAETARLQREYERAAAEAGWTAD